MKKEERIGMKKRWIAVLFMVLVLAACGTESNDTTSNNSAQQNIDKTEITKHKEQLLVLYKSNSNADGTMPFEQTFNGTQEELVPFIFSTVNEHEVELLDYTFEGDTSLLLNLGDDINSIQGSAGAWMFVESLVCSYFENYPHLQQVTFLYKGSYKSVLDHMNIGVPYVRETFNM